ncbi:spore germination protein [Paenibacillus oenotherae]|uniref:Spore germination protein n=1 Tax=Paenibacillus oenotherae TaxID=1435645 RepID=A0ABS7DBG8_9BACL|nr:GerAB/ArcD/ProY family transporter [Paenibacillus oenotherae]MBW7477088.1 spore germination protein [Paenibacillus oenotherae]
MERISKFQLGAMIILFQIGSTPLFEIGSKAKQDAWLVVVVSMLLGSILLTMFLYIQRREPEMNLSGLFMHYFGPWIGRFLLLFYVSVFAYESMRNLRDFGDLTIMTILPRTPISLIMIIILSLTIYSIYKGMEVFFRVAEFIVWGVLFFYFVLFAMYLISGIIVFDHILPVLENGIQPVIKESLSGYVWFPYGQMIIFLMFWNYLSEKTLLVKTTVLSFVVSGIVILITNMINLMVLGPALPDISSIPLLQSVQLIQIANILERFDAFVILLFYAGIFIKSTLWFLAAVLGLSQLFQTEYRKFALPVGAIIYSLTFIPPNWQTHVEIGETIAKKYMLNPIYILFIPTILMIIMWIRGPSNKSSSQSS